MSHRADTPQKTVLKRIIIAFVVTGVVLGGVFAAGSVLWGSYGDRILKQFGMVDNDYEGPGTGEAIVTIYEGEVGSDIAVTLAEAGVVKTSEAFYDLLLKSPHVDFMPGSYQLKQEMSSQSALEALKDPDNKMQFAAALREGLTVEQSLELLAAGTGIPVEKFADATKDVEYYELPEGADSLEGWLFPANYEFEHDSTPREIIGVLVNKQKSVLDSYEVAEIDRQRVLTHASIVQKEAGIISDFGKVSRVIQNRLDTEMKLAMDSTAQYGMGEQLDGSVWSSDEALADDNLWNTYVHEGLPVGPIANPGADAIEAALTPEPGDWLFFVVSPGGTGASTFTTNKEDHDKAVAEYRKWCESTPDSGC